VRIVRIIRGGSFVSGDWDATTYHLVSEPQLQWGLRVLQRLELAGRESVADVGCGTGRLTAVLAARVPAGRVTGIDASPAMLAEARRQLQLLGVPLVRASADRLPFSETFDVLFSNATFHWVVDHEALFASIFAALRPGGRLHAQCGGGPNLARLRQRAERLMASDRYGPHFSGWSEPWHYADAAGTARRLGNAGFRDIATSLEDAPVRFGNAPDFRTFTRSVCLRPYLNRLPLDTGESFTDELVDLAASDDPPFVLDYCRLNLTARRPPADGRA
jgi:trans-aconitate methyltransferase